MHGNLLLAEHGHAVPVVYISNTSYHRVCRSYYQYIYPRPACKVSNFYAVGLFPKHADALSASCHIFQMCQRTACVLPYFLNIQTHCVCSDISPIPQGIACRFIFSNELHVRYAVFPRHATALFEFMSYFPTCHGIACALCHTSPTCQHIVC